MARNFADRALIFMGSGSRASMEKRQSSCFGSRAMSKLPPYGTKIVWGWQTKQTGAERYFDLKADPSAFAWKAKPPPFEKNCFPARSLHMGDSIFTAWFTLFYTGIHAPKPSQDVTLKADNNFSRRLGQNTFKGHLLLCPYFWGIWLRSMAISKTLWAC